MGDFYNYNQKILGETYSPYESKYHRRLMISLLCSEWKEVVHIKLNHREIFNYN